MSFWKLLLNLRPKFGATNSYFSKKTMIGLGVISFGVFLLLLYPAHSTTLTAYQIYSAKLPGSDSLFKPVKNAEGLRLSWTKPQSNLYMLNVNRVAPLKITLYLNLERTATDTPLTKLKVNELLSDSDQLGLERARFQPNPNKRGVQPYSFEISGQPGAEAALSLQLQTNSATLKLANQTMQVGVLFNKIEAKITGDPYTYLLWPQPYIIAVLLLLLGLIYWSSRARLDRIETTLLVLPFSLIAASLMPFLIGWSWPLIGLAGVNLAMAGVWQRRFRLDWRHLRLIQTDKPHFLLWPVLVTGFALSLFITAAPSFIFDTRLFLGWNAKTHLFGPFNIYQHVSDLDYPPLIVYILWIYGWILAPLGLTNSVVAFKLFMSGCALGIGAVIWLLARSNPAINPMLNRVLVVTGLSAALLFNPAVWGQVDAMLGLMLMLAFWLVYRNHPLWAGAWLGLLLLFKPQAWVLLPLLAVLILKKAGWKRGLWAGGLGLVVALVLAIPAFGGDLNAFIRFWTQPSLAGIAANEANTGSLGAFNLQWLLGFGDKPASDEVTWAGFGLIALIYGLVLVRTVWKEANEQEVSLGAALLMVAFFVLSIKMRERYLYYALPLLGWACLYNRKTIKPFLVFSLLCMVNTLYGYLKNNHHAPSTSFYIWPDVIQPVIFSWLTLLAALYLLWLYLQPLLNLTRPRWQIFSGSKLVGSLPNLSLPQK